MDPYAQLGFLVHVYVWCISRQISEIFKSVVLCVCNSDITITVLTV